MRAQQIWHWLYVRGAQDFTPMSSISKEVRGALEQHFTLERPEVVTEQVSADGTRKWLLKLASETPGERPHLIETVYIPESDRGTLCVSSQVGCTLTCSFCHTGTQRLVRNLTAGEIVGQIMVARDRLGDFLGADPCHRAGPADRRRALRLQHRDDGDGRAALQFRGGARRAACGVGRRRAVAVEAAHHAVDLGRRFRTSRAPAPRSAACSRSRCMRCATICATNWCR